MEKAKVYFTKEITPESLVKIYNKLEKELNGNVAIKISTGEPGGHNYLKPELIKDLVNLLKGTIVECNTAYAGRRNTAKEHWKAIKEHGFLDISKVEDKDVQDVFVEEENDLNDVLFSDNDTKEEEEETFVPRKLSKRKKKASSL